MRFKGINTSNGITLVALIITIIVLLILAGITISSIVGDNGILIQAINAKTNNEIAEEKEIINVSKIEAIRKDKKGNIEKDNLQEALDNNVGQGKTIVCENDDKFEILFTETNRYYEIDEEGNLKEYELIEDKFPGDITKDQNGNELDGSLEHPYEINNIEDLVSFSNITNGNGYKLEDGTIIEITEANSLENKYVILKRTLNFNSMFSYIDCRRTDFGDINGNADDGNSLMNEMTTGTGFRPVYEFHGYFNGNNNEIQNLYINREGNAGIFIDDTTTWIGCMKKLENLGVTGSVTSSNGNAAGICCSFVNEIDNCWNSANVTTSNAYWTAGIATRNESQIKNCYNTGNITSTSEIGTAGGICTTIAGTDIENCYNTGNISANYYAGGICSGHGNGTTTVKNSYNTGNVYSGSQAGGILGTNGEIIENCYNTGKVTGRQYASGIVGSHAKEIYNCYNTGDLSGVYTGGIAYKMLNKIINCYNLGNISGCSTGGIVALNETSGAIISNSFNAGNVMHNNNEK